VELWLDSRRRADALAGMTNPYDDAAHPRDLRRLTTKDVASPLEQVA
jgi:hypothetical protein